MAIIQPQLWEGYPLLGDDGYPVVDPACCCPATPPPEEECTFCLPDTFSSTTAAVVDFTGSIADDGCDKCEPHMMDRTFELPRIDLPEGGPFDPCVYYLAGNLGCNVSGSGYDWIKFGWYFDVAGSFVGELELHYYCSGGGGGNKWTTNPISYIPTKHNCLVVPAFLASTTYDSGCSPYAPCNMGSVGADVSFLT